MRTILVALAALLLAGCTGGPGATREPEPSGLVEVQELQGAPAPAASPREFTTTISDGAFQHARLDAAVGMTIHWWNVGDEVHAVYSDDGAFPSSGPLAPGSEFGYNFLRAGDYSYHCPYHAGMTGTVVVR